MTKIPCSIYMVPSHVSPNHEHALSISSRRPCRRPWRTTPGWTSSQCQAWGITSWEGSGMGIMTKIGYAKSFVVIYWTSTPTPLRTLSFGEILGTHGHGNSAPISLRSGVLCWMAALRCYRRPTIGGKGVEKCELTTSWTNSVSFPIGACCRPAASDLSRCTIHSYMQNH